MAADISSLARMLRGCEEGEGKRELVTRDLLGEGAVHGSTEVDLELIVPAGWERRLDLESGRTYLQKREAHPSPRRRRHCLNLALPPPSMDAFSLDLDVRAPHSWYQSVCTLDKVRSALERAGREDPHPDGSPSPLSSSWASETSSAKQMAAGDWDPEPPPAATMVVGGCPVCFLYVLVSAAAPRCPRCGAHVPAHSEPKKRHKFDLNSPNQEQQSRD
ncbi:uncharacterized protein LOC122009138 [Zingiber officinale]|uniref:uncharacterized protein LOC122009138 n=1 Tax=Zingiber officinale TaxID=94328 RepID=UPI001C4AC5B9|nr:uncharacterized protein LOC122009138 [Zingiber officinale]